MTPMNLPEFAGLLLEDVQKEIQFALDGMTLEQLTSRPSPEANSMAWLAWHIARFQDLRVSRLTGRDQLWIADAWHEAFSLPADPDDTGKGHTDEQVATVRPKDPQALKDYCRAAHDRVRAYLGSLPAGGVDQPVADPSVGTPTTVGAVLFRMVHGGLEHTGQLSYVRGLIEHRHWFPR